MNNPNKRNPFPNDLQESSKDPLGFIYSTYSAAPTDTQTYTPLLPPTEERIATVSYAVGGSVSTVAFEESTTKNRLATRRRRSGGIRGRIRGFSRVSRRNLLRRLASINRTAFRAFEGKVFFLTLTYPRQWPEDPEVSKRHLKAFLKRLERSHGKFAGFWRLGIQKRGAWHFHLLLFAPPSFAALPELRAVVASAWYEVTGEASEGHLRAGTYVELVRRWRMVTSRAEKYLAREEHFPEGLQTGRIWGVWNEGLLPVRWESIQVGLRDAFRIRRIYRKLARRKGSGPLRRITAFVEHVNVIRLLGFLGYQLE